MGERGVAEDGSIATRRRRATSVLPIPADATVRQFLATVSMLPQETLSELRYTVARCKTNVFFQVCKNRRFDVRELPQELNER